MQIILQRLRSFSGPAKSLTIWDEVGAPERRKSNLLLAALEELEDALSEETQMLEPMPEP